MSALANSQPLSRQFAFICGRSAWERQGTAPGFAALRATFVFGPHRRIEESVPC